MSKKKKGGWTSEEKVEIVKSHLLEGIAVSELCERHGFSPALYYQWQKHFFENGSRAFENTGRKKRGEQDSEKRLQGEINRLEGKLRQREEVVSELMSEHIALKKSLGEI